MDIDLGHDFVDPETGERLYSSKRAGYILDLGTLSVNQARHKGLIQGRLYGGKLYITFDELLTIDKSHRVKFRIIKEWIESTGNTEGKELLETIHVC